jgi:hypothetical protein
MSSPSVALGVHHQNQSPSCSCHGRSSTGDRLDVVVDPLVRRVAEPVEVGDGVAVRGAARQHARAAVDGPSVLSFTPDVAGHVL